MNKNVFKNKLRLLQGSLILVFIIFLLFLLLPKNYTKNYSVDNIEIEERYNKKEKMYYFTFKKNDLTLDFLSETKYSNDRKLISKIEVIEDNNNFCLIPRSKKINFVPICRQDDINIHFSLVNDKLKEGIVKYINTENKLIDTWETYEIYNDQFTYLLWNYDGFYYINNDTKKKINILDKEIYNINLVGYTKDYLVIPDYSSDYTFNNFYTIEFKNGNLKKKKLDRNIYFDSYFIGYEKNKIYIVDNKESQMYEYDAKKGELNKIGTKVLSEGIWEKANIKTLINKKEEFSYKTNYVYTLEDNKLYLNYKNSDIKKLVTDNVNSIIRINDKDIFYLKESTLYHFNEMIGEEKLLSHFEWNFNNSNMIYIN